MGPSPVVRIGTLIARLRAVSPERGASLVEYALLVAFIAIVCVSAVTVFGQNVSEPISSVQYGLD